jgi:hypothetical protein
LLDKSTLKESAIGGYKSTKVKPGAAGLVRAYKTALKSVCSRVNFKVEMRPGGLGSKEVEIRREELKGQAISSEITALETKSRNLADLVLHVLGELYSNHRLDLLDWSIKLYIHVTRDHLLYLFLAGSCPSFSLLVANTGVLRDHLINDNLILILLIQVRIYGPWTVLVGTTIPRSL